MVARKQETRRSVRKPHFFKVLLGDFKQRLKIPPNFLKHIPVKASKKLTLQGPSGSTWNVELGNTISGTYLSTGWSKFVKDQSLREYEFLVFRYDGKMHFTVLIFDKTACEREDLLSTKRPRKPSSLEGKARSTPRTVKRSSHLVQHREIKIELPEHSEIDVHSPDLIQNHCSESVQGRYLQSPKRRVKAEQMGTALSNWVIAPSVRRRGCYTSSTRRIATDEEKSKAWEAAMSFTSSFPHHAKQITARIVGRPYVLRLPKYFSCALPSKKTNLVLRDSTGRAWVVIYTPSTRNRICGGWVAFARGNNLEIGDCCVFEIVGPVEMHVHIYRAVHETSLLEAA